MNTYLVPSKVYVGDDEIEVDGLDASEVSAALTAATEIMNRVRPVEPDYEIDEIVEAVMVEFGRLPIAERLDRTTGGGDFVRAFVDRSVREVRRLARARRSRATTNSRKMEAALARVRAKREAASDQSN